LIGYAVGVTPGWGSNHFSIWGQQAAQDQGLIQAQVAAYMPDYLLVELGFNDIGWFVSDPPGLLITMETLITNARSANPNVNFAIANVPQRTFLGAVNAQLPEKTTTYNGLLAAAITGWSTATSKVQLVHFQENYDCGPDSCPAGHDGLHPNALGEYQIAQAFSNTLVSGFGIGSSPLVIPADVPERSTPVPTNLQAVSSPDGITVTWDAVYGAFGYDVRNMLVGGGDWSIWSNANNRYDTTWTLDGWEWEYQVRTNNGDMGVSDWTAVVSAVAHPQTPQPPIHIITHPTTTGIDFSWTPPTGAYANTVEFYEFLFWDSSDAGSYVGGYGVTGTTVHIDGLNPGGNYVCAVQSWGTNGASMPGSARGVIVGAGTPDAPSNLQVTSLDPVSVQIDWCGSANAAGYRVWLRDVNNASSVSQSPDEYGTTSTTTFGVGYLFPGVWNWEFCITAYNGDLESGKSNCVTSGQVGQVVGGPVGGSGCITGSNGSGSGGGGGASPTSSTPSSPTSTPSSTATSIPDSQPWFNINCSHGTLQDDTAPGPVRWADADAQPAWEDALDSFEQYRSANPGVYGGDYEFSELVAQHVHGTPKFPKFAFFHSQLIQ
jgi:lysophospholipase L1-like esterase